MDIMINNKYRNSPFIYEVCALVPKCHVAFQYQKYHKYCFFSIFSIFVPLGALAQVAQSGTKKAIWAETAYTQHANR